MWRHQLSVPSNPAVRSNLDASPESCLSGKLDTSACKREMLHFQDM